MPAVLWHKEMKVRLVNFLEPYYMSMLVTCISKLNFIRYSNDGKPKKCHGKYVSRKECSNYYETEIRNIN